MPLIADVCAIPVILPHAVVSGSAMGLNPSEKEQQHRIGISLDDWARNTAANKNVNIFTGAPTPSTAAASGYVTASSDQV
ncbi:glycoside hydrolase family 18 protein [Sphaerobolus stellatus SS14]|uniref:Unplaced genomic scaffold SPHSTscaffold_361, whole genome shotgun sequence n=1 Tax=Sphaerobolus stellatus (strain SS14) TaxID=990650 RepID=A0A0C9UIK9_SPHS4|nr:glycoside hydrolase family 18 protein [Sphaerobolus stellatus SS14]